MCTAAGFLLVYYIGVVVWGCRVVVVNCGVAGVQCGAVLWCSGVPGGVEVVRWWTAAVCEGCACVVRVDGGFENSRGTG